MSTGINFYESKSYTQIEKSTRMIVLLISLLILSAPPSQAQESQSYITDSIPEKIYLQLDTKVYTTDQTIWFKSILTDAGTHQPSQQSGVLYVELINPAQQILEKKLIKIENGIGAGHFELRETYTVGSYLIRAYTKWNKNFDSAFFFETYIQVFSASENERADLANDITLIQKDSLQIQTNNQLPPSQGIVPDEEKLDVQFFPEGGELVHGLRSKVAFKALDTHGKGKYIEGEIINQNGKLITPFKSNALGMGYFSLPIADSTLTYFARLHTETETRQSLRYPLPPVAGQGHILYMAKQGDKIQIMAESNYRETDSLYFRISCRGMGYYSIKGRLKDGKLRFSLPANSLPEGIIAITMTDPSHHPIAERLFFNARPESRLNIGLSTDKDSYVQRELTTLEVDITNHKKEAANASLSVLVLNKDQLGQMERSRENILSYFLLSSDLKGNIETPRFYFTDSISRHHDLEALMLTQGWRKYNYTQSFNTKQYTAERALSVSGSVKGGILKNKKKEHQLTLATLGETQSFQVQAIDKAGKFNFSIPDEYGDSLKILIQTADKVGRNKNYTIELDQTASPSISFDPLASVIQLDNSLQKLLHKNAERKKIQDAFRISDEGLTLEEVLIEGYSMTPQRRRVLENFGKPRLVINGKDIQEREEKWSSGLFSVLLYHYPDKIKIVQDGPNMYARVIGAPSLEPGDGVTLIVVDGILVQEVDYQFIPAIPPSEVKSVEIIQSAKNFRQHYMKVDPGTSSLEAPSMGSVIAIYTHAGKGLLTARKPLGLLQASVPVFAQPKEFYSPKYPNPSSINWKKPDLRALVHWEPQLTTDSSGKGSIRFYNADNLGEMMIIVEAISSTGEIGYEELIFKVGENKH